MAITPRRIGVLTGGGDCPGLNAVIRAVTKDALFHGIEVRGILDGFLGLIEDRMRPLLYEDVSNILTTGGTILGSSNRANPARFATGTGADGQPVFEDVIDRCMGHAEAAGLDALVVIGGDGTLSIAADFVARGLPCVGVPKTIDNDVWGTELTFGFLTAVATATEALDRVHTTAASHHRALVVEVMGRYAGWIALHAGIASGSDIILIPELPFGWDAIFEKVTKRYARGKTCTVVCVAEGAKPHGGEQVVARLEPRATDPVRLGGIAQVVADAIERNTEVEARAVVLGHVQRGGAPVPADRVLSTRFGHAAMELVRAGASQRLVAWQRGRLVDIDLRDCANKQRTIPVDDPLIAAARAVWTSFGD